MNMLGGNELKVSNNLQIDDFSISPTHCNFYGLTPDPKIKEFDTFFNLKPTKSMISKSMDRDSAVKRRLISRSISKLPPIQGSLRDEADSRHARNESSPFHIRGRDQSQNEKDSYLNIKHDYYLPSPIRSNPLSPLRKTLLRDDSIDKSMGIFLKNKKRFTILKPMANPFKSSVKSTNSKPVIWNLKKTIDTHLRSPSKIKNQSPPSLPFQFVNEVDLNLKKSKEISPEDQLKISILKKKVLITKELELLFSVDKKKLRYKELLIEHHPDKGKYPKIVCENIFNFLVSNKARLLGTFGNPL